MTEPPLRIAMVIGETSGDALGAPLVDAMRRLRPDVQFAGVAGEGMMARGLTSLFPMEEVAVMGFGAIVRHLPRIIRRGFETVHAVRSFDPHALVIIDSPGFTHAVARRVARARPDLPIVNYVSPSVWAWHPGRAKRMTRYVDHVLALLPFEPEAHRRLGGPPCTYVGHPVIEKLAAFRPAPDQRRSIAEASTLLVLPGSRRTEIGRLLQPFGEAVALIVKAKPKTEVLLPAVPHLADMIEARVQDWPVRPRIVRGEAAKLASFRRAHAALAASGTVTLELGLAGVPTVVAYRVDPIVRPFKRLLKAPSIVLANLVLGENVMPEFLDAEATPQRLARETLALLTDSPVRRAQLAALARLPEIMAVDEPPSERAARIVIEAAEAGRGRRLARLQRRPEMGT